MGMQRSAVALAATWLIAAPGIAWCQALSSQAWPSKAVTIVVPFTPGVTVDISASVVGEQLSRQIGQPVVIENRGGAGGNLAAKAVSGAASEGYTILATTTGLAVNETASKNKGFSVDDLRTVAIVAFSPDVLAVHPSNPAKDLPIRTSGPGSAGCASSQSMTGVSTASKSGRKVRCWTISASPC